MHVVSLQNLFSSLENLIFPQGELIIGVLNSGPGTRKPPNRPNRPKNSSGARLINIDNKQIKSLSLGVCFQEKDGGEMEGLIN